ncbi:alcohol dehydrogenase [Erwinia sp. OLTSP20]|uniref:aldo/keto reductase n=1 Tax=unclassified Erwinia TaxID=2622719 RepID=UPI000C185A53|nr:MULTISPECIES: aldo/keto reductase [unclassified Erwinia]PIJ50550.1 alcohol dehydrogenase [Erwinia sp. OAMSP11]PIJ72869.1 alcohol dehydrogenase [Erwinia sp. OLSSP12]PIJ82198.1 alcohol dehydrogenase [Erwinia sp. OLCASP19]PIJ84752.1 alcohol dehydrogenase [Erwinia sp. OLMTSP26]PIJ86716.1 alcohol dehydrogenase [Erwinia sp. OLMDSP33]
MSKLTQRQLGRSHISVPPLTFGGNVFGWTVDQNNAFSLLDALVDRGLNFIDTADCYSRWAEGNQGGESETIIGNWLKKTANRDKIILATKVGMDMGEGRSGLSGKYIRQAIDASLRRLQTDYVDLYQAHCDDPHTPLLETLETFDALIAEGKVRIIGASNYTAERLTQALKISENQGLARYETLQPEYNLYDRSRYEGELEAVAKNNGLAVINYYSLASGFLSGKYRHAEDAAKSKRGQGVVEKYLNPRGLRILAALDAVAQAHNASPTQVALAWQIARPGITAPIVSATSVSQLDELVKATRLTLSDQQIALLAQASAG